MGKVCRALTVGLAAIAIMGVAACTKKRLSRISTVRDQTALGGCCYNSHLEIELLLLARPLHVDEGHGTAHGSVAQR